MTLRRVMMFAFSRAVVFFAALTSCASTAADVPFDTGWSHDENSGDGFTYFTSTALVDCAHTRIGYRQSADLFTGGYSHAPDGHTLSYADMGILLQNDDLKPGEIAEPNKVQLYGQASTSGPAGLLRFTRTGDAPQMLYNVACDSTLTLTYYVASDDELDVRYTGDFVSKYGGKSFGGTLVARIVGFTRSDGWSRNCASCAVRRVNTLAVSSGSPTRPGAYFGILETSGRREPTNQWSRSVEGHYVRGDPSDGASYATRVFTARPRDIVNAPADGEISPASRPAFLVLHEGMMSEKIGLDQRPTF